MHVPQDPILSLALAQILCQKLKSLVQTKKLAHFTITQINRTSSQGRLPPRFKLQICYFFEILAQDPVNNLARIKEGQSIVHL